MVIIYKGYNKKEIPEKLKIKTFDAIQCYQKSPPLHQTFHVLQCASVKAPYIIWLME